MRIIEVLGAFAIGVLTGVVAFHSQNGVTMSGGHVSGTIDGERVVCAHIEHAKAGGGFLCVTP